MGNQSSNQGRRDTFHSNGSDPTIMGTTSTHRNDTTGAQMNFINHPSEAGWRAEEWIKSNPDAWKYIVDLALTEARHERHFSVRWLCEQARRKDFTRADGEPFKINNTLSPAFARILKRQYPELAPYLETRRAACDGLV